jgi:hypothetical protein
MSLKRGLKKNERAKHIQGNGRKKKGKFVTEPMNIIGFQKKGNI